MSSSSPPSNVGGVDLESVLNVRRRTLAAIGETSLPCQLYRSSDAIYLMREDNSNSVLSINSKIVIYGELQLLCGIFERFTSNIIVHEESTESKPSFSATFEDDEAMEEDDTDASGVASTLRQTSISSQSSSPSRTPGSPLRYQTLSSIGRSQTLNSTASDYFVQNLDGKRYGSIQLPTMTIIEILEIFLRTGLELIHVSSEYDNEHVLHQNYFFSKNRPTPQKVLPTLYSRSSSFVGTQEKQSN